MFKSHKMKLNVEAPERLLVTADQEFLRIALDNYLSKAAKYGKEGGRARLNVVEVVVTVWNEGGGFSEEEGRSLFGKFTLLKNAHTRT